MSWLLDAWTAALLVAGTGFFLAGTVGLLRFGDVHSRLHAVAKADTVGLGLVVVALVPQAGGVDAGLRLLAVWLAALAASATACTLLAQHADRRG